MLHSQVNPMPHTPFLLSPLTLSYTSAGVTSLPHDIHVYAPNVSPFWHFQVKPKRRKPSKVTEEPQLTQELMLAEAAMTELYNARSLALLLAREEAAKARTTVKLGPYTGPTVRYISRRKDDAEEVMLESIPRFIVVLS